MVRTGAWRAGAAALLLLAALGLAGCGAEEATDPTGGTSSPQESPSAPEDDSDDSDDSADSADPGGEAAEVPADAPECATVWQEGSTIPRSYQGCVDDAGDYVERDALGCSSGQRMVRYADHFYGVLGGTVHEAAQRLDRDRDYRVAVRSCRA